MRGLYWVFRTLFIAIFKICFCFKVVGEENVPDKGGVIVVTNHVSYLDPFVVGCAIKRQATYMARAGLFSIPLIRVFVRLFSVPVKRDRPQPSTIKEIVGRLKRGELVIMFPEGGRSKDGNLLEAKRGVGMIAAMAGAVVVPAFIDGTYKALPVGARFIRPAKVSIMFGLPFQVKTDSDKDIQEKISDEIMDAIRSLKEKVSGKSGNARKEDTAVKSGADN